MANLPHYLNSYGSLTGTVIIIFFIKTEIKKHSTWHLHLLSHARRRRHGDLEFMIQIYGHYSYKAPNKTLSMKYITSLRIFRQILSQNVDNISHHIVKSSQYCHNIVTMLSTILSSSTIRLKWHQHGWNVTLLWQHRLTYMLTVLWMLTIWWQ